MDGDQLQKSKEQGDSSKSWLRKRFLDPLIASANPPWFDSRGIAVGLFVGMGVPIGLHMLTLGLLRLIMRYNVVVAFAFTFVNNPITIIDPVGLQSCKVRLIVHTAHRKLSDQNTFDNVAKDLEEKYRKLNEKNVEVLPREFAETGKEIVEFINAQDDDSILSLDIFSHSNLGGIHISRNIKPQLSPDYKRQLHDWIRDDQNASDAEFMEESYHGLFSDPAAAWGVSVYFNQVAGDGIAYLPEIDFAKFTTDAKVEFHGCKTAMELEEKDIEAIKAYVDTRPWLQLIIRGLRIDPASIQVTNFARRFSEKLGAAGKTEAKVTGHVGKSGPPEKGPGGNSYQYGHRRVYQNGELIEELY